MANTRMYMIAMIAFYASAVSAISVHHQPWSMARRSMASEAGKSVRLDIVARLSPKFWGGVNDIAKRAGKVIAQEIMQEDDLASALLLQNESDVLSGLKPPHMHFDSPQDRDDLFTVEFRTVFSKKAVTRRLMRDFADLARTERHQANLRKEGISLEDVYMTERSASDMKDMNEQGNKQEPEPQSIFDSIDENRDGLITQEEAVSSGVPVEDAAFLFPCLDTDSNGHATISEFKEFWSKFNSRGGRKRCEVLRLAKSLREKDSSLSKEASVQQANATLHQQQQERIQKIQQEIKRAKQERLDHEKSEGQRHILIGHAEMKAIYEKHHIRKRKCKCGQNDQVVSGMWDKVTQHCKLDIPKDITYHIDNSKPGHSEVTIHPSGRAKICKEDCTQAISSMHKNVYEQCDCHKDEGEHHQIELSRSLYASSETCDEYIERVTEQQTKKAEEEARKEAKRIKIKLEQDEKRVAEEQAKLKEKNERDERLAAKKRAEELKKEETSKRIKEEEEKARKIKLAEENEKAKDAEEKDAFERLEAARQSKNKLVSLEDENRALIKEARSQTMASTEEKEKAEENIRLLWENMNSTKFDLQSARNLMQLKAERAALDKITAIKSNIKTEKRRIKKLLENARKNTKLAEQKTQENIKIRGEEAETSQAMITAEDEAKQANIAASQATQEAEMEDAGVTGMSGSSGASGASGSSGATGAGQDVSGLLICPADYSGHCGPIDTLEHLYYTVMKTCKLTLLTDIAVQIENGAPVLDSVAFSAQGREKVCNNKGCSTAIIEWANQYQGCNCEADSTNVVMAATFLREAQGCETQTWRSLAKWFSQTEAGPAPGKSTRTSQNGTIGSTSSTGFFGSSGNIGAALNSRGTDKGDDLEVESKTGGASTGGAKDATGVEADATGAEASATGVEASATGVEASATGGEKAVKANATKGHPAVAKASVAKEDPVKIEEEHKKLLLKLEKERQEQEKQAENQLKKYEDIRKRANQTLHETLEKVASAQEQLAQKLAQKVEVDQALKTAEESAKARELEVEKQRKDEQAEKELEESAEDNFAKTEAENKASGCSGIQTSLFSAFQSCETLKAQFGSKHVCSSTMSKACHGCDFCLDHVSKR